MRLRNLSVLDLSRTRKVKFDSAIGFPVYGFLIMLNINTGPNYALL